MLWEKRERTASPLHQSTGGRLVSIEAVLEGAKKAWASTMLQGRVVSICVLRRGRAEALYQLAPVAERSDATKNRRLEEKGGKTWPSSLPPPQLLGWVCRRLRREREAVVDREGKEKEALVLATRDFLGARTASGESRTPR